MKSRKVIITIEVKTDTPADVLKNKKNIVLFYVAPGNVAPGEDEFEHEYYPEIIRVEAKVAPSIPTRIPSKCRDSSTEKI